MCWTWADHVLEWFDQGVAAGPDIRAFEYRKPRVRINVSSSTLVHNDVHCARVPAHSDPRFLLIHLGTVGLFVEEVQTISQLGVRDVGAEDGHRPELPKRLKPTVVVVHPVDRSPATIGCARRRHDDDADSACDECAANWTRTPKRATRVKASTFIRNGEVTKVLA